jgi:membrane associated rhomboid family serine protease
MPSWFPRRGAAVVRPLRTLLRSSPPAVGITVVLVVASAITGTLTAPASAETASWWASGASTTLDGRPWTAVTALLISSDPLQLLLDVVLLLPLLAAAERRLGSLRTLVAFLFTGAVGTTLGTLLQSVGSAAGEWWATDTVGDHTFDPLIGGVGALIAATAAMGALWRRRIRVTTFSVVLMFVLYAGDSADVYRMIAGLSGLAVGAVLVGGVAGVRLRRPVRSSHRESRALLAAIVAVTAIGPLVAVLSDSGYGPFSFLGRLLQNAFTGTGDLEDPCGGAVRH